MRRRLGILAPALALGLAAFALGPALAHDGSADAPEEDGSAGMAGGHGMMQGGMEGHQEAMRMMMHCMSMMEQMHDGGGAQEHPDMGGMGGMGGMGMSRSPGTEGGASGPHAATAEALARAYLRGKAGDEADVEILDVALQDDGYAVHYRQGRAEGTLLVEVASGEVSEAPEQ